MFVATLVVMALCVARSIVNEMVDGKPHEDTVYHA